MEQRGYLSSCHALADRLLRLGGGKCVAVTDFPPATEVAFSALLHMSVECRGIRVDLESCIRSADSSLGAGTSST